MNSFKFVDINWRGLRKNYIVVNTQIRGTPDIVDTHTHTQ